MTSEAGANIGERKKAVKKCNFQHHKSFIVNGVRVLSTWRARRQLVAARTSNGKLLSANSFQFSGNVSSLWEGVDGYVVKHVPPAPTSSPLPARESSTRPSSRERSGLAATAARTARSRPESSCHAAW